MALNTQRYVDRDSGALFTPRTDADTIKVMIKSGQWREATESDLEAHAFKVTAAREARATRELARATEAATFKAFAEAAAQRALANAKAEVTPKPAEEVKPETAKPTQADPPASPPQTPPAAERPSRGASLAAWADFAKAVSFEHAEGASRDEIRDAYEAAHPAG